MPVQKGDRIYIPPRMPGDRVVQIKWTDWFREYSANYVVVIAKNQTQNNEDIQLFIAEEWYNNDHLSTIGARELPPPGGWLVDVTERFQYGQSIRHNHRFLVYHDKDNRSPYQLEQHMFMEGGQHAMLERMGDMMQSVIPGFLESLASSLSSGTADVLGSQFGDLLENF